MKHECFSFVDIQSKERKVNHTNNERKLTYINKYMARTFSSSVVDTFSPRIPLMTFFRLCVLFTFFFKKKKVNCRSKPMQ
jgi:hypothetical protein